MAYEGDPRTDYFNGKLLTSKDLGSEQDYQRSTDRLIGESTTPLLERFVAAGRSSVILYFDEADALFGNRTDVGDSHDRYNENFLVLDESTGRWHGRLYLDEYGSILPGIYDDLGGSFENVAPVPVAGVNGLFLLALGALVYNGRRRIRVGMAPGS